MEETKIQIPENTSSLKQNEEPIVSKDPKAEIRQQRLDLIKQSNLYSYPEYLERLISESVSVPEDEKTFTRLEMIRDANLYSQEEYLISMMAQVLEYCG